MRTAPEIKVSQDGLILKAHSNDPSGIKSWHTYTDASDPSACDENLQYVAEDPPSGNNYYSLSLTAAQNDSYYCFKAVDGQGNTAYSASVYQVDTVAPTLTVAQPDENATVIVTVSQDYDDDGNADGNTDIDVDSWQYVQTTQACANIGNWRDLDTLNSVLSQDKADITFSRSAVGRTYCFRVADEANNYASVQHKVTTINEPPVINRLYQNKQSVIATATDRQYLNNSSWQYAVTNDADCDSSINSWHSLGGAFSSDSSRNQGYFGS